MSWMADSEDPDRPIWAGQDSIFDMYADTERVNRVGCWGPIMVVGLGGLGFAMLDNDSGPKTIAAMALFIAPGIWLFWLLKAAQPEANFLGRCWVLEGNERGLSYLVEHAPGVVAPWEREAWSVMFDEIASVESGRTNEWQAGRHYRMPPKPQNFLDVSEHEYQTFLFLSDGTRRVLYSANADREGTAALAQSVRAWLEKRRTSIAHLALKPADGAAPEGFDL